MNRRLPAIELPPQSPIVHGLSAVLLVTVRLPAIVLPQTTFSLVPKGSAAAAVPSAWRLPPIVVPTILTPTPCCKRTLPFTVVKSTSHHAPAGTVRLPKTVPPRIWSFAHVTFPLPRPPDWAWKTCTSLSPSP